MLLRLSFVLLMAFNIALGAWLLLGQDGDFRRPATDPGVPRLALLSESRISLATATGPTLPRSAMPTAASVSQAPSVTAVVLDPGGRCLSLGPFATLADLQQARAALAGRVQRSRSRQEQVAQTRDWWVHLPPSTTHAQALALTRNLAARQLADYFVTGGGVEGNTVSLGLFKDHDNARKRRDQVVAAGFPAQLTARTDQVPQYWLDLVFADRAHTDWRRRVHAPGIASHSTACF